MSNESTPDRWVTWAPKPMPCCGAKGRVYVYPSTCDTIECDSCGRCVPTPLFGPEGKIIPERGMSNN